MLSIRVWRSSRHRLAPSAARTADSLARHDAGELQVGDVGAGNQEHATHRAKEQPQVLPVVFDVVVQQGEQDDSYSGVRIRVASCQIGSDAISGGT